MLHDPRMPFLTAYALTKPEGAPIPSADVFFRDHVSPDESDLPVKMIYYVPI